MKRIYVNIYLGEIENIEKFEQLLPNELDAINALKDKNVLEHSFVKENKTGALLIFQNLEEHEVKEIISELPLFSYFKKVDYDKVIKQF